MTLYETMFTRRSVRKYDPTPLDSKILDDMLAYVKGVQQLEGQHAEFRILPQSEIQDNRAPHYIIASCEESDAAYANVGFVLEQADLYLQSIGLGSLWIGNQLPNEPQHGDCIMMAFGRTNVPLRQDTEAYKRLPLKEISDTDNCVIQAVRLAPSAANFQPWKVECTENEIILHYFGRGPFKAILRKKHNMIDLGIAARFAVTALEHSGISIDEIVPETHGRQFKLPIKYHVR